MSVLSSPFPRPLLLLVMFSGFASSCAACNCVYLVPEPKLMEHSDGVILARPTILLNGYIHNFILVKVDKVWKGDFQTYAILYTDGSGGSCGATLTKGASYVVMSDTGAMGLQWISSCTAFDAGNATEQDLASLGPWHLPRPSFTLWLLVGVTGLGIARSTVLLWGKLGHKLKMTGINSSRSGTAG